MTSVILPASPSESRPGRFGIYGGRYVPETLMAALVELERELRGYPSGLKGSRPMPIEPNAIVHPLRLAHGDQVLSFISTITVFGTPLDVTLSELAIESFFPADEQTRAVLARLAKERAQ